MSKLSKKLCDENWWKNTFKLIAIVLGIIACVLYALFLGYVLYTYSLITTNFLKESFIVLGCIAGCIAIIIGVNNAHKIFAAFFKIFLRNKK